MVRAELLTRDIVKGITRGTQPRTLMFVRTEIIDASGRNYLGGVQERTLSHVTYTSPLGVSFVDLAAESDRKIKLAVSRGKLKIPEAGLIRIEDAGTLGRPSDSERLLYEGLSKVIVINGIPFEILNKNKEFPTTRARSLTEEVFQDIAGQDIKVEGLARVTKNE